MKPSARIVAALAVSLGVALLAAPGGAGEAPYRLGEGDVLEITVWKKPELSRRAVVRPDGMITLPLIQDVKAAGLTPAELRGNLSDLFTAYVTSPDVSVTVEETRSYRAYVLGAVATNGSFAMQRPITAAQLLAQAGGPTADADLAGAFILREGRKLPAHLSISALGEEGQNPVILPSDTLTVPYLLASNKRVLVVGEVATPKAIPYREGLTAMDVLLETGGATPFADISGVRVLRPGDPAGARSLKVDLNAMLGGDPAGNIPLEPGDTIVFPAWEGYAHRVLVLGQVRNPRSIPYRRGMTVLDAYAEAGGGTEWADESSVLVARRKGDGGTEEIRVNVKRIMGGGNLSLNVPLSPGDMVFVPR